MASWSETTKHEPSSINGGRRYEKPDRVPREQLNLITENSFYAVNKSDVANANSENALVVANNAFEQSKVTGTQVTVGGEFQTTFNADTKLDVDSDTAQFAQSERQKSKNLLPYHYSGGSGRTHEGVTFTVNEDSSFNISGTNTVNWGSTFEIDRDFTLKAGTYTCSFNQNKDNLWLESSSHGYFRFIDPGAKEKTFTLNKDTTFTDMYIVVERGTSIDISNLKIQLERNDKATGWVFPYGEIVHNEEIADVEHIDIIYDKDTNNIIGGTAYTSGIQGSDVSYPADFSAYKKIKFYAICDGNLTIAEVDLADGSSSHNGSGTSNGGSMKYPRFMYIYMSGASSFRVQFAQWQSSIENVGLKNNDAGYYIYRIEGVKRYVNSN